MTLGLCFWILMLLWLVLGVVWHFGPAWPYWGFGSGLLLFILMLLLGWQTFGPPIHR